MKISEITIIILALGVIACNPKANTTDLHSIKQVREESKLQLAQANSQNVAKYFNSGIKRLEQGDYQGAIDDFTKAIEINPTLVAAYYNRAIARHQLQNYQRAIADFTKVIQINPKIAIAYYNQGIIRGQLQDFQGAIADFTSSIEINPKLDIAYYNRGVARSQSIILSSSDRRLQ
ncbi:MAG: tetratricopeptide repeat protein [Rivularia sp. (in: cyanobacteria)]